MVVEGIPGEHHALEDIKLPAGLPPKSIIRWQALANIHNLLNEKDNMTLSVWCESNVRAEKWVVRVGSENRIMKLL